MSSEFGTGKLQAPTWNPPLERALGFAPLSLLLLFGPAWFAVMQANALADRLYDSVSALLEPLLSWLNTAPTPLGNTGRRLWGIRNAAVFAALRLTDGCRFYGAD